MDIKAIFALYFQHELKKKKRYKGKYIKLSQNQVREAHAYKSIYLG
jgi:hypothetical protein